MKPCLLLSAACLVVVAIQAPAAPVGAPADSAGLPDLLDPQNLTAWCVVPFDARKRGPEQRAEMLQRLGFRSFAYDWRAEHVPTFDAELEALKQLWDQDRPLCSAPTDGWKQKHDDSYYRNAVAKQRKQP